MTKSLIDGPDIEPFKAHDIRKLRKCVICGDLGYLPYMLFLPSEKAKKQAAHGTCVVASMTHNEILALPVEERAKLRLNQTGAQLMKKLVEATPSA